MVADQRIHKVAMSLCKMNYCPILVGRLLQNRKPLLRPYPTKRFSLLFKKGFFFYAEYNLRLFFYLLFAKADVFLSNDLDTLTANFLASRIRHKKLVYDSHEFFTEVPELLRKKTIKKIWSKIEALIMPKLKTGYTVSESIADAYFEKYGIKMKVVRNLPMRKKTLDTEPIVFPFVKKNEKVIYYQGALNMGRGLEHVIKAMKFIKSAKLIIVGEGDISKELRRLTIVEHVSERVIFLGRICFEKLYAYTRSADIGICLEENLGLNYYYSLPNKLFDYIQANVPILASPFPEVKKIVNGFDIGELIEKHSAQHIAEKINSMIASEEKIQKWKKNLKKAAEELCWENEEIKLKTIF